MKNSDVIAIIGGGPAGCTLASLLAMRGRRVIVFDDHKRPELLVGESLIPSVIPVLRKLQIEDRVREFSTFKPGASFFHGEKSRLHFSFTDRGRKAPGYAYNVPRPQFDNLLRERAIELGVQFVDRRAELLTSSCPDRDLELGQESLQLANLSEQPQWLIDGTGRARLFAKTLKLPATQGPRKDAAYFAHFKNFEHDEVDPGQVIISVLENGWSWRIPLPDRLSVGIVLHKDAAKRFGSTPEERLENAIASEPLLREKGQKAQRISPVMSYSNYQLIGKQGHGKRWIMLGDAFGFVDPMLSPGLFMALESASLLDSLIFSRNDPKPKHIEAYVTELNVWHRSWQELINYFYDGSILRMHEAGSQMAEGKSKFNPAKIMEGHMNRVIASMAGGVGTRSVYNRKLLKTSSKHLIWNVKDADHYSVK